MGSAGIGYRYKYRSRYTNLELLPPVLASSGLADIIGYQAHLIDIWTRGNAQALPSYTPEDLRELFKLSVKIAEVDQKKLRIDFLSRFYPLLVNGSLTINKDYRNFLLGKTKGLQGLSQTFLNFSDTCKERHQRSLADCEKLPYSDISLFLKGNTDYGKAVKAYERKQRKAKSLIKPYVPCFDLEAVNLKGHHYYLMPSSIRRQLTDDGSYLAFDCKQFQGITGICLADNLGPRFAEFYAKAEGLYRDGQLCGRVVVAADAIAWDTKDEYAAKAYENTFSNEVPIAPFTVEVRDKAQAIAVGRASVYGSNHVLRLVEHALPETAQYYSRKYRDLQIKVTGAEELRPKVEVGMLFASIKYSILHCSYRPKYPYDHLLKQSVMTERDRRGIKEKCDKGNLPCNRTLWVY